MNLLPFGDLPPFKPRTFLPTTLDLGDWASLAPQLDRLKSEIQEAQTKDQLEQWLLHWGELSAALDEESSRRYIAMTCHTDNAEAEKAYLQFIEDIEPKLKPRDFELSKLFLEHPCRSELAPERYGVFDRDTSVAVELFRDENVPLETEESKLGQQYQKLSGSLTVTFRGEEKTLTKMAPYLEEPDRALREEVWRLVSQRRLKESASFEDTFDQLVQLREKIAGNAGFANYRDYAFRARGRFDYTPQDCLTFHESVETEIMPLVRQLQARRREQLGLEKLRPWDLAVDPLNRSPLRPFSEVEQMVTKTQGIFDKLDPDLGADFKRMREQRLLDLDNRKGKAPGGYQCSLSEARLPFIFMNAVGVQRDVETMLHEAGHAFHALAADHEELYAYRHAPIEFCEVASMSMELLGNEFLDLFYAEPEANRARQDHLEGIIKFFPWMAAIDGFQHWIYSHPGHSREERTQAWLELMDRFGDEVDWSGFEDVRANLWHRQLHLFLHPFYYVEYGIAQLGALQVWANSKKDKVKALQDYKAGLALGGARPLPDLFAAAGCRFDFSAAIVKPLIGMVQKEWDQLTAKS